MIGDGFCTVDVAMLEVVQPLNFNRVNVWLSTLVIKEYKSLPSRKSFEIECGKLKFPILPKLRAVGIEVSELLKFRRIISLDGLLFTTKPKISLHA